MVIIIVDKAVHLKTRTGICIVSYNSITVVLTIKTILFVCFLLLGTKGIFVKDKRDSLYASLMTSLTDIQSSCKYNPKIRKRLRIV